MELEVEIQVGEGRSRVRGADTPFEAPFGDLGIQMGTRTRLAVHDSGNGGVCGDDLESKTSVWQVGHVSGLVLDPGLFRLREAA
jgi:hypothetical protein